MKPFKTRVYQLIQTWANTNNHQAKYAIDRLYEITDAYKLTEFVFNHPTIFNIDQLQHLSNAEIRTYLVNIFNQLAVTIAPNENNGIRAITHI